MKARDYSVLLVDGCDVVRAGYHRFLEAQPSIRVVAETCLGKEAYRLYGEVKPDIVVMDFGLNGMSGLEASRRIISRYPDACILAVSVHNSSILAERALQLGVLGYITKSISPRLFIDAITKVASGVCYVDSEIAQSYTINRIRGGAEPLMGLSPREFEVFRLFAEGKAPHEIAALLDLSEKTVANYTSKIKKKLNIATTAGMAHLAIRSGVIVV